MADKEKSRVRVLTRTEAAKPKAQAYLSTPSGKEVTRGGLVFDTVLDAADLQAIYKRDVLGHRDLSKTVGDIFNKGFDLEGEDEKLIEAMQEVNARLRVTARLHDAFKAAMLDGHCLLYKSFKDRGATDKEVEGVQKGPDGIQALSSIYKADVEKLRRVTEIEDPRFKLLQNADIHIKDPDTQGVVWKGTVHHTRVTLITWDPLYGSLVGLSYFSPSHDAYKAWKNTLWAMGETFHRNAAGTKLIDPGPEASVPEYKDLEEVFKDIDAAKEVLVPPGTKVTTVKPTPIPPQQYVETFLKTVSSMPQTLLLGTQAGRVAGSETNLAIYYGDIAAVQQNIVTPLLMDFYDQLQELGVLPEGDLPAIVWRPLWEPSEEDQAMTWERLSRAARVLAGNELRGDPAILTVGEIRRMLFTLEEELPEAAAQRKREQFDIPPDLRDSVIGRMTRATDPVMQSWAADLKQVTSAMAADVRRVLRQELKGKVARRRWALRRSQMLPPSLIIRAMKITGEAMEAHAPAVKKAMADGYLAAIHAGTDSVELTGGVSEQETAIQTLIFPKDHWDSAAACRKWARDHDFRADKVDETGTSWRLRQRDPGDFSRLRTICIRGAPRNKPASPDCNIKATFGPLKEAAERTEQEVPGGMGSWWEANSTQWSDTYTSETVAAIKATVRRNLEAEASMAQLEYELAEEFNLTAGRAEVIARTETIRAASEARVREYHRLGVRRLIFMSTPDDRTDPECWSLDGVAYTVEASSGVIPVHPNCRCTWIAEKEVMASRVLGREALRELVLAATWPLQKPSLADLGEMLR